MGDTGGGDWGGGGGTPADAGGGGDWGTSGGDGGGGLRGDATAAGGAPSGAATTGGGGIRGRGGDSREPHPATHSGDLTRSVSRHDGGKRQLPAPSSASLTFPSGTSVMTSALVLLMLAVDPPAPERATHPIMDRAGLFSPAAVAEARHRIDAVRQADGIDLTIETADDLPELPSSQLRKMLGREAKRGSARSPRIAPTPPGATACSSSSSRTRPTCPSSAGPASGTGSFIREAREPPQVPRPRTRQRPRPRPPRCLRHLQRHRAFDPGPAASPFAPLSALVLSRLLLASASCSASPSARGSSAPPFRSTSPPCSAASSACRRPTGSTTASSTPSARSLHAPPDAGAGSRTRPEGHRRPLMSDPACPFCGETRRDGPPPRRRARLAVPALRRPARPRGSSTAATASSSPRTPRHANSANSADDERARPTSTRCACSPGPSRQASRPHKLNYELLGNQVPHLHWHLFPRSPDDPDRLSAGLARPRRAPSATRRRTPARKPAPEPPRDRSPRAGPPLTWRLNAPPA